MSYSKEEIEAIVKSCSTEKELTDACISFKYLIDNNYLKRTLHINTVTGIRYMQLTNKK